MTSVPLLETKDTLVVSTPAAAAISPDASEVAFVVSVDNHKDDSFDSALWRLRDGVAAPIAEVAKGRAPQYLSDGTLSFIDAESGIGQLALLESGKTVAVTTADTAPFGVSGVAWAPDASKVAVVVIESTTLPGEPLVASTTFHKMDGMGRFGDTLFSILLIDRASGEVTVLRSGMHSASSLSWSPDGRLLAFSTWRDDAWDQHHVSVFEVLEVASKDGKQVFEGFLGLGAASAFTPDGSALIITGLQEPVAGNTQLLLIDLASGELRRLAPELDRNVLVGGNGGYPGSALRFSADGRAVMFTIREGGVAQVYSVDYTDPAAPAELLFGDDRSCIFGLDVAHDGTTTFVRATDTEFAEVEIHAPDGSLIHRTSLAIDVPVETLLRANWQERWFETADGTRVQGWLLRPADAVGATPVLLDVHGGPHNAWMPIANPGFLHHHQLVARGWSVLIVNPRGSDGYGDEFFGGTTGKWGYIDADDLTVGLHTLVAEGLADKDRLAVTGYSYGGFSVCSLTSKFPQLFAAGIAGGLVSDLASIAHTADLAGYFSRIEMGQGDNLDYAKLRAVSPIADVHEVRTPTLILHGLEDQRCPVQQAEAWFAGLREAGVPSQMVIYPGGSHLFFVQGKPSQKIDYRDRVLAWLDTYVPAA
ncbi:prolyl oligopeptidase family serine peptidase [Leucobacter sp. UT-8R-CII-1-4]|uniref:S9 family peptidase n=1 Tax=Leucobacter sp. UT-8R-CII-1-4 TaxID=3040075 RepID=UPI0024A9B215|nr:prolyl oligopeptidase family serine peptidase [Leucobacter sp. UT-8R-CII-1-4]MDI6022154.1 prolyl oligopeptidase family serine peptidase [Leucobacter sp. UT-8R-CII-1-4]